MSIDESLEWLISRKEHYEMDDNCQELAQALDVAIDTMNKYQKIQDLIEYHMLRFLPKERMSGFQQDVLEVLENGIDD